MSRARAQARAEREAEAARRASANEAKRVALDARRARRQRRSLTWRRLRLWQHGPRFRRETWGAIGTVMLLAIVVTYLVAPSFASIVLIGLVLVLVSPVLAKLFFERK